MNWKCFVLIPLAFIYSGCHSLDSYEWVGADYLQGEGGAMKKDGDVEIWVQGEPNRKYKPIKIVETTTTGTIGVQSYLFGVLKKQTKKFGGDGFILMSKDVANGGTFISGTAGTTTTGSLYGNTYSGTSTTAGSAIAVPVRYNTYRALIFKYVE